MSLINVKNVLLIFSLFGVVLFGVVSCATGRPSKTSDVARDREKIKEVLGSEVSLTSDREKLSDLRKEIPESTQVANDDLSLITNLMLEPTTDPSRIRQQYQHAMQKRRHAHQTKAKKLRDEYKAEEQKRRDEFLKQSKIKRDEIRPLKLERSEMQKRYQELDKERNDFFAEERDRRKSFESELSFQVKTFNDDMSAQNKEFNEQMREYTKRYNDRKNEQRKDSSGQNLNHQNEFKQMSEIPGTPLEP